MQNQQSTSECWEEGGMFESSSALATNTSNAICMNFQNYSLSTCASAFKRNKINFLSTIIDNRIRHHHHRHLIYTCAPPFPLHILSVISFHLISIPICCFSSGCLAQFKQQQQNQKTGKKWFQHNATINEARQRDRGGN